MTPSGSIGASERLFARARTLMPGGVSSPVRAFKHVGGTPRYVARGEGALVWDEDGRQYVDYCLAWGPMILGHAHPAVVEAVTRATRDGLAFGTCHRHEVAVAEKILAAFAPADRVRLVTTGTEAVMTALRIARAHTKRTLVLKFTGCYHGHADAMLVKAGSGVATLGLADSEGVTVHAAGDTVVAPLGDVAALEQAFKDHGDQLAAAIIEPVPANNGLLLQEKAFLHRLRELTLAKGALLIFDEVITGFRFGFHGYSKVVGLTPDLTTLGKIVGGGLPVGAVVGRGELIDRLAPAGGVYQAGTMAGNPVALASGLATLTELETGKPYQKLQALSAAFDAALAKQKKDHFKVARQGPVFWPYYDGASPLPTNAEGITDAAVQGFRTRYGKWLEQGIYLPPSAYEVGFFSSAHEVAQVEALARALAEA